MLCPIDLPFCLQSARRRPFYQSMLIITAIAAGVAALCTICFVMGVVYGAQKGIS